MPFDPTQFLVAPLAEDGAFMAFRGADGMAIKNDEGETVGVFLRARNSRAGLAQVRVNGNKQIQAAARGGDRMTVESNEANMTELLVACTARFVGFDTLDGAPFGNTPSDYRKFWSDDRFRRERERAEDFVGSEANFTKA